jgi:hypothetical protein
VGISIALQYIQIPAIDVTSVRCSYDLDSRQIECKNKLVLGSRCTVLQVCMEASWTPEGCGRAESDWRATVTIGLRCTRCGVLHGTDVFFDTIRMLNNQHSGHSTKFLITCTALCRVLATTVFHGPNVGGGLRLQTSICRIPHNNVVEIWNFYLLNLSNLFRIII